MCDIKYEYNSINRTLYNLQNSQPPPSVLCCLVSVHCHSMASGLSNSIKLLQLERAGLEAHGLINVKLLRSSKPLSVQRRLERHVRLGVAEVVALSRTV